MRCRVFAILAMFAGGACSTPPAAQPTASVDVQTVARGERSAPPAVEPDDAEPFRTEIYTTPWPSLDATLLGVDPGQGRAYIKLRARKPARYAIDTVDLETGERIERWEASPDHVEALADYDGRFTPLDDRDDDLARLAGMLSSWSSRARREGSAWPVADAAPDGKHLVFMQAPQGGRDGDWLFLHRVDDKRSVRFARHTVASYDAKFSPDGELLAWRGCIGRRPCRYHLYLSTVSDAARGRPARRLDVRDPGGPTWHPRTGDLLALGTMHGKRCITATQPPAKRFRPPQTSTLTCDEQLAGYALAPDGRSLVAVTRDGDRMGVRYRHFDRADDVAKLDLENVSEVAVSDTGKLLADHREGMLVIDLHDGRQHLYDSPRGGFVFVPNVHWLSGDVAIMLEKSFVDQRVRLVRMDLSQLLGAT